MSFAYATGGEINPMGAMILFGAASVMAQEVGGGIAWFEEDPATASYDIISGSAGIGLGLLYRETENLLIPMIVHGLYDALALAYIRLAPPKAVG